MKTKYILHGGYTSEDNSLNKKFFVECFADAPEQASVLIVLFAREETDDGYYENLTSRLQKSTDKKIRFEKATEENFETQVMQADIVFLQGGSTERILSTLKKYSDLDNLFSSKTIVGSSAGAYVLGVLGAAHSSAHMREGLGILPVRVVCHYKSKKQPPSNTSLEELKNSRTDLELVLLRDFEHRIFYEPA